MPLLHCPHCRTPVDIHPDDAGYKVLCPSCHSAFQAGDAERPPPPPLEAPPVPVPPAEKFSRESRTLTTRCTICRGRVEIGSDDLGHLMECPLCGEKFRADDERRSRREDDSDEDEDDDDDLDRRRNRGRYRKQDRGYILDSARAAIAWPSNGLMWTGIVCSVLCLLLSAGLAFAGSAAMDDPDPYEQDGSVTFFIWAVLVALGVPYHLLMAFAGYRMKKLDGVAWAYTGAGLGIATMLITGICSPTTWASMTFGIWALVAYSKREVLDAIRINTGRS